MRASNGPSRRRMIKRVLAKAKGFYSGRHKMYRVACEAVRRAEAMAFSGRKLKKRQFRQLWIHRIGLQCREQGIRYSQLIFALNKLDIRLDRKQLSELAIHQPAAFAEICARAKALIDSAPKTQAAGSPAEFGFKPRRQGQDDLEIIEGIGPKIAGLLRAAGITTFAQLAEVKAETIQAVLTQAGSNFNLANPASWPQQAALAAKGDWAALRKLMDVLVGGVAR